MDAATLALTARELKQTLTEAKIAKIFEPTRDELVLTLRTRTDTYSAVAVGPQRLGPGLPDRRELREPRDAALLLYADAQASDRRQAAGRAGWSRVTASCT